MPPGLMAVERELSEWPVKAWQPLFCQKEIAQLFANRRKTDCRIRYFFDTVPLVYKERPKNSCSLELASSKQEMQLSSCETQAARRTACAAAGTKPSHLTSRAALTPSLACKTVFCQKEIQPEKVNYVIQKRECV